MKTKVLITVIGGVVWVTTTDPDVEVFIVDWDNINAMSSEEIEVDGCIDTVVERITAFFPTSVVGEPNPKGTKERLVLDELSKLGLFNNEHLNVEY